MKNLIQSLRTHLPANDFAKLPAIIALLFVGVGVLFSYLFADTVTQQARRDFENYTRQQGASIANHVSSQVRAYEQLLLDHSGIFSVKENLTYEEWRSFIRASRVTERYPSLLAIGYVTHLPITYIEPYNAINQRAVGFDMASNPIRAAAIAQARDSASVQMSEPVKLVQDGEDSTKKGVLIYYPVYEQGADMSSIQLRREKIRGYIYVAVRPEDMLAKIDKTTTDIDEFNYSMNDTDSGTILASQTIKSPENVIENYDVREIRLLGRIWQLDMTAYQPTLQRLTSPGILLLLGIGLSVALGVALYRLLKRSFEELQQNHEDSLMQTKNDLLALASHQLRTPASGVKQYLGILTQGFVGELTQEQQTIAKKAYSANERQLETINQILHVAKADAGQLSLDPTSFDLTELTQDVIESMEQVATQKQILLKIMNPNVCKVIADERYVRMVIENLISNAVKYSDTGRVVRISIKQTSRHVKLSVRDYGVGIAQDDIEKLFHKFSRINNKHSRAEGGTGLGLFLAYHIAKAHGGDIIINSIPGEGSTFSFVLPYRYNQRKRRDV